MTEEVVAAPTTPKRKRKLVLLALPVLLGAGGAGLWFTGVIPGLLGHKPGAAAPAPLFVDVPELMTNLNVAGKRPGYVKLHAKIEVPSKSDEAGVTAAMPRIQDMFQTYLRDMHPEELRGSAGTYRLRQELIARADAASAPSHVANVLFVELVIE